MNIEDINSAIEKLKSEYLDCKSCPPERNCCSNISHLFEAPMKVEAAKTAYGDELLTQMLDDRRMYYKEGFYILRTPCPLLTADYLCSIHGSEKMIDLQVCNNFPLYAQVVEDMNEFGYERFTSIKIDARCFSMEKNWKHIHPELIALQDYETTVSVIYRNKEDSAVCDPLDTLLEQGFHLPRQRI